MDREHVTFESDKLANLHFRYIWNHGRWGSKPPRRESEKPRFKNMVVSVSSPPKDLYTLRQSRQGRQGRQGRRGRQGRKGRQGRHGKNRKGRQSRQNLASYSEM